MQTHRSHNEEQFSESTFMQRQWHCSLLRFSIDLFVMSHAITLHAMAGACRYNGAADLV